MHQMHFVISTTILFVKRKVLLVNGLNKSDCLLLSPVNPTVHPILCYFTLSKAVLFVKLSGVNSSVK
jgi:hypothetical protein